MVRRVTLDTNIFVDGFADIFLTALCGNADYLISNNREFIREAVNKGEFKCLTPEEFILKFQE